MKVNLRDSQNPEIDKRRHQVNKVKYPVAEIEKSKCALREIFSHLDVDDSSSARVLVARPDRAKILDGDLWGRSMCLAGDQHLIVR